MDEGEIDRQLRKLVEQLKHENERLRASFNSRNGQIESQTKSNPILYGHQKIFAALFRSFAGCPDSSLIGHFTVIRLFVIYNLVDGLRDRSLDVLEEHIKRVTPPKDNSFIPKSCSKCQSNLDSEGSETAPSHLQHDRQAVPGWRLPVAPLAWGRESLACGRSCWSL